MMRTVRAAALATALLLVPGLIPATALAADVCSDFGGTVEQDGLCRLREEKPNYTLAMSFPVDFPDQGAVDDFVTQTRTGFLNETKTPNFANVPYALEMQGMPWASDSTRSVSFEIYENLGGAHPNTWYKTFNYDTAGGARDHLRQSVRLRRQPVERDLPDRPAQARGRDGDAHTGFRR